MLCQATYCAQMTGEQEDVTDSTNHLEHLISTSFFLPTHNSHRHQRHGRYITLEEDGCLIFAVRSTSQLLITPGLEVIRKLKIKRNDWLLADTCPQAANH